MATRASSSLEDPRARSAASPQAAPVEPEKKKSRKKLMIIVLVLVAVLGGVYFMKVKKHAPAKVPGMVAPLASMTVNTDDGSLLEIRIALQLAPGIKTKVIAPFVPQIDNATISDIGKWSYTQLLTSRGRTRLQDELLASYQQVVGDGATKSEQVTSIYFMSFVMQK